jgi:conjugative transposon TraN protein
MKKLCALWFVVISLKCFSQVSIEPFPLQVGINKTTNIIFPYGIKSVDRGSRDVLVQKATGIENVLQVKANTQDFVTTNLSVITADGKLYSFIVHYITDPPLLNLSFAIDSTAHFNDELFNTAWLENEAAVILRQKNFLHHSSCSELMKLSLNGIYIDKGLLWFKMNLSNHSLIGYRPDYFKFFIQDKHKAKRTAEQRTELEPIYQIGMPVVNGNSKKSFVFAFDQFTLPKGKRLVCQVSEQNGGRLLKLHLDHKALLKARAPFTPDGTR